MATSPRWAVLALGLTTAVAVARGEEDAEGADAFAAWAAAYNKTYCPGASLSCAAALTRRANVEAHLAAIAAHNAQPNATFTAGLNAYSDLSREEFLAQRLGFRPRQRHDLPDGRRGLLGRRALRADDVPDAGAGEGAAGQALPEEWDWRDYGVVGDVEDQGSCGSCYAFSANGAIQSINAIKSGELLYPSEQQVVDCECRDLGCNGGSMHNVFEFAASNGGLTVERDYPYEESDEEGCKQRKNSHKLVRIDGHEDVPAHSDAALMRAVYQQPVSVAVQGSDDGFQNYESGVLTADSCGVDTDHALLVVGWGTEDDVPYWLCKNSWGESWGEDGYIKLERGNEPAGTCGILSDPTRPTKSDSSSVDYEELEDAADAADDAGLSDYDEDAPNCHSKSSTLNYDDDDTKTVGHLPLAWFIAIWVVILVVVFFVAMFFFVRAHEDGSLYTFFGTTKPEPWLPFSERFAAAERQEEEAPLAPPPGESSEGGDGYGATA